MTDSQQQTPAEPGSQQPPPAAAQRPAAIPPALLAQLLAQRGGLPYAGGPIMGMPLPMVIPQAPTAQAQVQLWQGQFPPPDAVKQYEQVLPGSFNRMIAMAERLQEAQIEEVRRAQDYTANDSRRGHWLGFSATFLAIVGAIGCTVVAAITGTTGPYIVAAALVSVPVMAVAKSLIESAKTPSARDIMKATAAETAVEPPVPSPLGDAQI